MLIKDLVTTVKIHSGKTNVKNVLDCLIQNSGSIPTSSHKFPQLPDLQETAKVINSYILTHMPGRCLLRYEDIGTKAIVASLIESFFDLKLGALCPRCNSAGPSSLDFNSPGSWNAGFVLCLVCGSPSHANCYTEVDPSHGIHFICDGCSYDPARASPPPLLNNLVSQTAIAAHTNDDQSSSRDTAPPADQSVTGVILQHQVNQSTYPVISPLTNGDLMSQPTSTASPASLTQAQSVPESSLSLQINQLFAQQVALQAALQSTLQVVTGTRPRLDSNESLCSLEDPLAAQLAEYRSAQQADYSSRHVIDSSRQTPPDGPNHQSDQADQHHSNPELCRRYTVGKCPHGKNGNRLVNGRPCRYSHPVKCPVFQKFGNNPANGCILGNSCTLFHPKVCKHNRRGDCSTT